MNCTFRQTGTGGRGYTFVCCVCGRPTSSKYADPKMLHRRCTKSNPLPLGDLVSDVLGKVGLTPKRMSRMLGRPCGCMKRKRKLNRLGAVIADKVRIMSRRTQ